VSAAAGLPWASSYDPAATTAGGFAGEVARLAAQAELSFGEELRILRDLGIADTGQLLELGAGSGAVTRLLRSALPGLPMICLDIDESLLRHASGSGGTLVVGDAARLPLRSGSVGGVLLRYVVQHVPAPDQVLAEALRVLRPGGLLAVVDVDAALWGLAEPLLPDTAMVHTKIAAAQASRGGDRLIGRRLTRLLRAAGFNDVAVRLFVTTSDDRPMSDFAPHLGPERLVPLLAEGTLTLRDFTLVADRWRRFCSSPDSWVMLLGFIVAGRAPGRAPEQIGGTYEPVLEDLRSDLLLHRGGGRGRPCRAQCHHSSAVNRGSGRLRLHRGGVPASGNSPKPPPSLLAPPDTQTVVATGRS
jgi:SAM-dependent methyltransferase